MFTKKFIEITADSIQEHGGKASHLGELTRAGFNVPPGFCVVSEAFQYYIKENDFLTTISNLAKSFDYEDFENVEEKSAKIRFLIENGKMPCQLEQQILQSYNELGAEENPQAFVAIRSSVSVKDALISSFPGMMDTYHYIRGDRQVIEFIKKCWASVWNARAVIARHQKTIEHEKALIAPIVQVMVNSEVAGVVFTANPVTSSREEMLIEANWGLGESVVSGKTLTDVYTLDKRTLKIKDMKISLKNRAVVQSENGGVRWCKVEPSKSQIPALSEVQTEEVGAVAASIEEHYGYPQDIEWAYEAGKLYILQSRKITTLKGD